MDEIQTTSYLSPWDHRFCFELALGLDKESEILERYNVSPDQYSKLKKTPAFNQQIVDYRAEIKEKGLSFKAKAKIMAEDLLNHAYDMARDSGTSAQVRLDTIKFVTKVADLEPKETKSNNDQQFLPAVAAAIKGIADGDLELQVSRIVSRRRQIKDIEHE